mmetsp:Transcript_10729/g.12293  ORF Transcript_10729/g.12293 Transcript_10729/m.12293 type:complete len:587 (-) Transcript_10729:445-2205(-)|eukprot:CAMPEP_0204822080 /NCGR_PEP_ID=MMETSP1346-20131115/258_1 /ASSEMBLY_ACC=CAM_ASM_000771 /TAXON_ID=215587 /ORGANISM="Aplanochytrium stocchinoi, Strain GSBS06" /LENGTH=586 /DNA_ID=CAMNT_0051948099 /DNA_START=49 /DNA_END=1809 /DNA_ORIENTATION=+
MGEEQKEELEHAGLDEEQENGHYLNEPLLGENSGGSGSGWTSSCCEKLDRYCRKCEKSTLKFYNFKCVGCCFFVSLFLAFIFPLYIKYRIHQGVRENVIIHSRKASGFKQFANRSHTGDDRLEFFFFNLTNPHKVLKGAKPHLEEIGPFVYNSFQVRSDFKWNSIDDTLSYREHTWYTFNRKRTLQRTNGKYNNDTVRITTLNMLFFGMKAQVGLELLQTVCDFLGWTNDFKRLFTQKSISELLQGYEIDIPFSKFPIKFPGIYPNLTKTEDPDVRKKITMRVGEKDINQVYELIKWRNMRKMKVKCPFGLNPLSSSSYCQHHYPCCQNHSLFHRDGNLVPPWGTKIYSENSVWDHDANLVHGRNGEQFSPHLKKGAHLYIFNKDLARTLMFENRNGKVVKDKGIKMLRFTPSQNMIKNSTEIPSHSRYRLNGPKGILANISILQQGCPIFVSFPHFLYGDEKLQTDVIGLNPNEDIHQMRIDVEPILGQTMEEHARTQVNSRLFNGKEWEASRYKHWFKDVRADTFVPIMWFDQISEVTQEGVREFKQIYIADDARDVFELIGGLLFIASGLPLLALCYRRKYNE